MQRYCFFIEKLQYNQDFHAFKKRRMTDDRSQKLRTEGTKSRESGIRSQKSHHADPLPGRGWGGLNKIASLALLDRNDGLHQADPLLGGAGGGLNKIASSPPAGGSSQ